MATNPHIYVSSVHGTNTGASDTSFASQQTGAMTGVTNTSVYDNIGSAIAGASPGDGDTIYVADDHAAAYNNTIDVVLSGGSFVSVDAAAIDAYKPGASENLTDTADDYSIQGSLLISGVSFETGDNVFNSGAVDSRVTMSDGTLTADTTNDIAISINSDGVYLHLVNVNLAANNAAAFGFVLSKGSAVDWYGGEVTTMTTLMKTFGTAGGATIRIRGVKLTSITTLFSTLAITNNVCLMRLENCTLNASVTLPTDATLNHIGQRFEMYNCDDTAGVIHNFRVASGSGYARNNDATYVTATETWYEGSDKSSIEVITGSGCSHIDPFIFELPAQYVDLSSAASDVLTLELTTDTALTLTDTDIAAFLVYPDGTTALQPNWVTSGKTVGTGNYGVDPLAAGTTLTTGDLGAGDWTGEDATSPNFYKMVLDTSGDAGQATAVSIRIEVYKASITAGTLFIHPLLTLS